MTKKRTHTIHDEDTGEDIPLRDADVDYQVKVFRAHRRKSVTGSPTECIVARGAVCSSDVYKAFIGSGDEVVLIFHGKGRLGKHALRYIARTNLKRVRDSFDQKGAPATQWVTLGAPTPSTSLEAKEARTIKEAAEKKAREEATAADDGEGFTHVEFEARKGGGEKKKRRSRAERLGVQRRPRATVSRGGGWSVPSEEGEAAGAE
jgi:hypothetical protein